MQKFDAISCMHPITVYGIETGKKLRLLRERGCMHPITVYGIETTPTSAYNSIFLCCMHPITVYGIETVCIACKPRDHHKVACTLLPFTVLKPSHKLPALQNLCCMHPITTCGIEKQKHRSWLKDRCFCFRIPNSNNGVGNEVLLISPRLMGVIAISLTAL